MAEKVLGCVPWYLPHLHNHKRCDPWTQREFTEQLGTGELGACGDCLADCEYTEYSVKATKAEFRCWVGIVNIQYQIKRQVLVTTPY